MNGYRPTSRLYNLTFAAFPGLEITAKSTSLGALTRLAQLKININTNDESERMEVFSFFTSRVTKWNIVHPELDDPTPDNKCARCGLAEGEDLPINVSGLLCLDMDFIMEIIIGWMEAVSKVTPGKLPNSNNGANNFREELMKELATQQSPLT